MNADEDFFSSTQHEVTKVIIFLKHLYYYNCTKTSHKIIKKNKFNMQDLCIVKKPPKTYKLEVNRSNYVRILLCKDVCEKRCADQMGVMTTRLVWAPPPLLSHFPC